MYKIHDQWRLSKNIWVQIRLLNVYAPSEPNSENLKNNFYRILRKATAKNQKHQKLLVLGDFNAKTSVACRKCDFDGVRVVDDDNCNDNGYRLKKLLPKLQARNWLLFLRISNGKPMDLVQLRQDYEPRKRLHVSGALPPAICYKLYC